MIAAYITVLRTIVVLFWCATLASCHLGDHFPRSGISYDESKEFRLFVPLGKSGALISSVSLIRSRAGEATSPERGDLVWSIVATKPVKAFHFKFSLFETPLGFKGEKCNPEMVSYGYEYSVVVNAIDPTQQTLSWSRYVQIWKVLAARKLCQGSD